MNAQTKIEAPANVIAKIAAVQGELAKVGIAKGRRNQQQGYNFRGIDEVYAALSPLLSRYGLVIIPRVVSRECVERQSAKGGALFNVTVHAEFDFVSADDGSIRTASTFGEAMDSADKATNKAMSAAYKYAAFMTFAIPTEGGEDADAVTHEVAGGRSQTDAVSPQPDLISDSDLEMVMKLCEAVGDNQPAAIMAGYKVKRLSELPATKAASVIARLNEKLAEKAKSQTNAKAETPFGELIDDEIQY